MSLAAQLSKYFPSAIRSRGNEYFRSGSVRIKHGSDWEFEGRVRGSENYQVTLSRSDNILYVKCTCPYFETDGACKHLWAAVLAADGRQYLKGNGDSSSLVLIEEEDDNEDDDFYDDEELSLDDDDDDDDWDDDDDDEEDLIAAFPVLASRDREGAPVKGKLLSWKEQLAALGRGARTELPTASELWPANRELLYVIDVPATMTGNGLILEVNYRDRKKDGEWGKPKSQRLQRQVIPALPEQADREIITLLAGAKEQFGNSYFYNSDSQYDHIPSTFRITGYLEQVLIPQICRTGRTRLRLQNNGEDWAAIAWDDGPPWEFWVDVRHNEKAGEYALTGVLRRNDDEMELSRPVMLLSSGFFFTREFAARLAHRDAFDWILFFRKQGWLNVPGAQADELLAEILKASSLPHLSLPAEMQYQEVTIAPRPCLTIKAPPQRGFGTEKLRGILSFDYGGKMVASADQNRGVFDPKERQLLLRDQVSEQAAAQQLQGLGWRYKRPDYYDREARWELLPSKLPRIVRDLLLSGWHVEAEGKVYRQPGEIKMQVSSGIDWFELHGAVDFGGVVAKLPELLAALRRGETMVKLGDGTFGLLPEEWLNKYGLLAGLGETHEDHLRFKRTQVGVLDALLATQPQATFDEAFGHAREALKNFDGVRLAEPPQGFQGTLRPYQKEGLGWLHFLRQFDFGGCLADDMGLGKTVQVLALLEERRQLRRRSQSAAAVKSADSTAVLAPSLVVVPKSLVFNWRQEAARFAPEMRVLDHTGQQRQKAGEHFDEYDLILTTYGTLRRDAVDFKDLEFDYLILDEAQAIKNADTASAKAARLLRGKHRLALSGTPIENHLGELWSLFEFLNPGMLGSASVFKLAGIGARDPDEETRKLLAQSLRPFILRRTKSQVAKDLPEKLEQTIFCELEPKQRKLYDELRDHYRTSLLDRIAREGMQKAKIQVLEALLRLRQVACHPGLIDKKHAKEDSAKLDMLLPQLVELFEEGHKVLVFSQFTSFLSLLREQLDKEGVAYEYLDGKTRDRQARVERFQDDPDCKLFLISLKAGGLGLNLTAAEYVYLLDPWWNPAVEAQAIDRAHRIGQKRQVFAYRLIAKDTVEEKVLQLQETKRDLADAIINADNSLIRNLGKEDLELLLS